MGSVYRKTITRALPPGATVFTRQGEKFARWVDAKGKSKTGRVVVRGDGAQRVRVESSTYIAKYSDGLGIVREVSTGCRSRDGALAVLKTLTDRAEKVKSGIFSAGEDAA